MDLLNLLNEWIDNTNISFVHEEDNNYIELSRDGIKRQRNYIEISRDGTDNENDRDGSLGTVYRFEYYLKRINSKYIFGIIPLVDYNEVSNIVIEFILSGKQHKLVWNTCNEKHEYKEIILDNYKYISFLKILSIYYEKVMVKVCHNNIFMTRTWVKRRKDICVSHYNKYYCTGYSDNINDINYTLNI